jgi:hypothetical protein
MNRGTIQAAVNPLLKFWLSEAVLLCDLRQSHN